MSTVKVFDRADEFRIEIGGRFAGDCVTDIGEAWKTALGETGSRRFMIDISRMTSYDGAGRRLLEKMYRHGMQIAAGTPLSLVFLGEISAPPRRGPALVAPASSLESGKAVAARSRPIAAGE